MFSGSHRVRAVGPDLFRCETRKIAAFGAGRCLGDDSL